MAFTAGQKLRASELRPAVLSLRRITSQAIPQLVWTAVSWNSEVIDTDGAWSSGAPTEVVIPKTGYWMVAASVKFEPSATGSARGIRYFVDGVTPDGCELLAPPNTGATRRSGVSLTAILPLTQGDVLTISAYQDSGGNLNVGTIVSYAPTLDILFIRD